MAKAKKEMLKRQGGTKAQRVQVNAIDSLKKAVGDKAEAKANAKRDEKIKKEGMILGERLVSVQVESHTTAFKMLLDMKGKSALELAAIKEGVKNAWKEYAEKFNARNTHSDKATVAGMQRASIYNRNSENQAVLSAFEKYAIMSPASRKEFDKRLKDCTAYHALVAFCRHFNAGGKGTRNTDTNTASAVAKRERKAWSKNKGERIAKIKQALRFATLDALTVLADYVQKRIAQEKRSLEQQSKGESGKVTRIRKAA